MATKKNIIVGAASIFLGPSGKTEAPPVGTATASYRATVAADNAAGRWKDVGYTTDGLEVSNDPSYTDIEVDQLLDAAKIFQEGMSVSLSTSFMEATLENLLIAWGQPSSALTSSTWEIDGGALGSSPIERGLIAVGNGPEKAASNVYSERTYHAYRVLSVESTAHTLARAEAVMIPVTFRALPDDNGKYGIVRDRATVT